MPLIKADTDLFVDRAFITGVSVFGQGILKSTFLGKNRSGPVRCAQVLTFPFKSRLINRRDPDPLGRRVRQEFNFTGAQGTTVDTEFIQHTVKEIITIPLGFSQPVIGGYPQILGINRGVVGPGG